MIAVSQMFLIRQPSYARIREVLAAQADAEFSYPSPGATRHQALLGYAVDHERFELGRGDAAFERAKQAIREWRMFDMGWIRLRWPAPIQGGSTVAVVVRHPGFYSLNVA